MIPGLVLMCIAYHSAVPRWLNFMHLTEIRDHVKVVKILLEQHAVRTLRDNQESMLSFVSHAGQFIQLRQSCPCSLIADHITMAMLRHTCKNFCSIRNKFCT